MSPYFEVLRPRAPDAETPVVVEVPHAGLLVPPHFATALLASARSIARDADLFVDELYEGATDEGATVLVARVSRYVVDLNRAETDVDFETVVGGPSSPRAPRGVVWRLTTDNERCLVGPLGRDELEARLEEIHRPYHAALAEIVAAKLERFGLCLILAGHSMPSVGRSGHGDAEIVRADVVPGTQGRTTAHASLIDRVDREAVGAGLNVRHDEPYRGGFTTRHWGRPAQRVHAIQVELARRLYMNEAALKKNTGFAKMQAFCAGLVRELGQGARALAASSP